MTGGFIIAGILLGGGGAYLYLALSNKEEALDVRLARLSGAQTPRRLRGREALYADIGQRLASGSREKGKPSVRADLAITGASSGSFAAQVVGYGAALFAVPALLAMSAVFGTKVPTGLLFIVAIVLGAAGAMLPFSVMRRKADEMREHLRDVVAMVTGLVALNLSAGAGIEDAVTGALEISDDWAFDVMRRAVGPAIRSRGSIWAAIDEALSERGVDSFADVRATLELAGSAGARVSQTLTAKAAALRDDEVTRAETDRNSMSERMFFPGILILVGFLGVLAYPALQHIVSTIG